MNLRQLREEAWARAREVGVSDSTRLWTKAEMNSYINRVYRHIARETRCIRDALTPAICQITVAPAQDLTMYTVPANFAFSLREITGTFNGTTVTTADSIGDLHVGTLLVSDSLPVGTTVATIISDTQFTTSQAATGSGPDTVQYHAWITPTTYTLDPRILDIDEAKWTQKAWRLTKVSVRKWQVNPWWEWVVGMPTEYATDYSNNTIALNFRTYETDTLRLVVRRLPLTDLVLDADEPEFRSHYHDFMLNGILMHMYGKQDAQTFDGEKKDTYERKFKEDVDEVKQQETILDQRLKNEFSQNAFR